MFSGSHDLARRERVNLLKKVKVNGDWKFCPAVLESDGRLKDTARHSRSASAIKSWQHSDSF